jgi:hypothetical protein
MFGTQGKWTFVAVAALLVTAAVALPALASSDDAGVEPAAFPADREAVDNAVECIADRGFGTPTPDDGVEGPGVFIPRSEAETSEFREAADACGLPEPPTDAEIRDLACSDAVARGERRD